ncbi:MAG TPA: hypothetical protein VF638_14330 [Sphingomonas sp.]|jgi:hypothetical protein
MGVARIYKFGTPYNAADLADVQYAQTANLMYFVHIDRPVQRLTRFGHTDWRFAEVQFGPTIAPPTGVTASASSPNMTGFVATSYTYVVTGISDTVGQESRASAIATVTNDLTLDGNYNTVSWTNMGYDRYAVYKGNNGVFGFIAGTEGTSIRDGTPIIIADLADTPPKGQNPLSGAGNYPSAITFHEQRAIFARTRNRPNAIFGTQSGDFENLDTSRPAKADDAFSFALVGKKVNAVNQVVSAKSLLALTTDSIFSVTGSSDNPIGPSSFLPKKQNDRGASRLPAIEIDQTVFFQPNQGSSVRALGFSFDIDGYRSNNVAIFSPHLFDTDTIVSWAYQNEPFSCIYAVMTSGRMLAFTWEQEQEVWGWTVLETQGLFKDVAVITEQGLDRVYVIVERQIGDATKRFYERMAVPQTDDYATACHLDCAVTQVYDQMQKVVTGLDHLEGMTVSAFYDGYAETGLKVTGGAVTLQEAANIVSVGLPYVAEIETLPLTLSGQGGSYHTNRQTIASVVVRAIDTKGVEVAVTGATFEPIVERLAEPMGVLPEIGARDYDIKLPSTWSDGATLTIRQTQPMPMHITGLFVEPDVGDD